MRSYDKVLMPKHSQLSKCALLLCRLCPRGVQNPVEIALVMKYRMTHPLLPVGSERPSPCVSFPAVGSPNWRFRSCNIASLLTWHHRGAAGLAVIHLDVCFRTGRAWKWAGNWSGESPGRECSGILWPRIQDGGRGVEGIEKGRAKGQMQLEMQPS